VLTLRQARRKAIQIKAQAILGGDPQKERQAQRSVPTLCAFIEDRYLPFVRTYKRSWQTDEIVLRVHVVPHLGPLFLDEITTERIIAIVTTMRGDDYASGTIARVIVILRFVFNLARKWNVLRGNENPAAGIPVPPDVERNRFLAHDETARLVASIEADENITAAKSIRLLLLTGARRNEITHAKWEHVDWEKGTLLVPMAKSGKPRIITLSVSALALLASVEKLVGNPYIFPSPITGRPSASIYFPWNRIRKRAGLPDVRLHDLRHSFASYLVNAGKELYIVQKLLGHSHARSTQRYAHLTTDTLADATEVVARTVDGATRPAE
jgi:integrase